MEQQVLKKITQQREEMFLAEKKVADYILSNPKDVVGLNVSDLAEKSGSSDATVIRLCKRLGYKGFYQMKLALAEELGRHQMTGYEDPLYNPKNAREVIKCLTQDLLRIADLMDNDKADRCAEMICAAKRVFVIAVGNSIPVAMDFSFRLCRLGINASCDVIVEYGMAALARASSDDLLVAVSHSGSSTYVLQAVEIATKKRIPSIAVTSSSSNPLAKKSLFSLLTTVDDPLFGEYGSATHIYDQAVLDAVLYLASQKLKQSGDIGDIESVLAEYKI